MKKFIAELMGTFVLVFGGVGSAVLAGDKIGYTGISLAFGLSLLAMVYTIGPISGCQKAPNLECFSRKGWRWAKRDSNSPTAPGCRL